MTSGCSPESSLVINLMLIHLITIIINILFKYKYKITKRVIISNLKTHYKVNFLNKVKRLLDF